MTTAINVGNATVTPKPNITLSQAASEWTPDSAFITDFESLLRSDFAVGNITTFGTGNAAYISCFTEWASWWIESIATSAISGLIGTGESTTTTSTLPFDHTTTFYPTNATPYTLCDGTPRVDIKPVTSIVRSTITFDPDVEPVLNLPPAPTCINPYVCVWLVENTTLPIYPEYSGNDNGFLALHFACPDWNYLQGGDSSCIVQGGPIQMLYWPVTTANGDLCLGNGSTVTGMHTGLGPNTFETMGLTLTSPTVYLSFATLHADIAGYWGASFGPTFANTIMPFPASDISTQCLSSLGWVFEKTKTDPFAPVDLGPATQINYADLNYPVPARAMQCARTACDYSTYTFTETLWNLSATALDEFFTGTTTSTSSNTDPICFTIYDDFDPILAAPTALTSLIPEWTNCRFNNSMITNTWWDPPVALQYNSFIAEPTTPSAASAEPTAQSQQDLTTPASPSSSRYTAVQQTAGTEDTPISTGPGSTEQPTEIVSASLQVTVIIISSTIQTSAPGPGKPPSSQPEGQAPEVAATEQVTQHASGDNAVPQLSTFAQNVDSNMQESSQSAIASKVACILASVMGTNTASAAANAPDETSAVGDPGGAAPNALSVLQAAAVTFTTEHEPTTSDVIVMAGQPLSIGGSGAPISGHLLSAGSGGVVVDGTSTAVPALDAAPGAAQSAQAHGGVTVINADGQAFTLAPAPGGSESGVVVNGQAIAPGQEATADGHTFSVGSGGVVVDERSTIVLPGSSLGAASTIFTTGGHIYTALVPAGNSKAALVNGVIVSSGQAATIGSHVSSQGAGGLVIDGSSTVPLSTLAQPWSTVLDVNGASMTVGAVPGEVGVAVVNGTTLRPGQERTIGGHTFSAGAAGLIFDGTRTLPLGTPATSVFSLVGGEGYSIAAVPGNQHAAVVNGVTLQQGETLTTAGHILSEGSAGLILDGSRTLSIPYAPLQPVAYTTLLSVGHPALTAYTILGSEGVQVVNGITLSRGQSAAIDGQLLSNGPSGLVVDGGSTIPLPLSTTVFTVSGHVYNAYSVPGHPGLEVVDGITISKGQIATIDGHIISDELTALVVDGMTAVVLLSQADPSAKTFAVAERIYTAYGVPGRPGLEVLNGVTLSQGQAVTLNGHVFSVLGGLNGLLVDGSSTVDLPAPGLVTPGPVGRLGTAAGPQGTSASTSRAASLSCSAVSWLWVGLASLLSVHLSR